MTGDIAGHPQKARPVTCLLAAVAVVAGATAQESDLPELEAGSSIFWSSVFSGTPDNFRERIVASGDDWQIIQSIYEGMEDEALSPESLFVLYSGIDYRSCEDGMLASAEERAAVAALYPLTEGNTAALTSMEDDAVVRVGEATEYFLMGAMRPAHNVLIDYEDDELDEPLIVLDDLPLTVRIDWDEDSWDKVMLVTGAGETSPETPTADQLGHCAVLTEQK